MRKLEQMEWWPELIAKKDDFSLRELAEMFGATPGAINNALKRNGIERNAAPPGPRSRRGRPPAPSKKRRAQSAKKAAAPAAPARSAAAIGVRGATKAKIEPYLDMLGQVPDSEIAGLAGLSAQTVARVRRQLDVKASGRKGAAAKPAAKPAAKAAATPAAKAPEKAAKPAPRKSRSKIAPFIDELGKIPDADIARKAGVSVNAVRNYRFRKGISAAPRPAAAKPEAPAKAEAPKAVAAPKVEAPKVEAPKAEAPAPAAPASAAPKAASVPLKPDSTEGTSIPAGARAYRVTLVDGTTPIVVGGSFVEVATKIEAAGVEASSIELLGEILA
ncbi:MAG: hypothetical protein H6739_04310 [Alphaproteobacteria bacterium]|nr:hypothetical protein [Alphaproteobacteria bacterium]